MNAAHYLEFLKDEIHSTVFATVDKDGLPVTCVIDIMMADENSLYFLTAKGKAFYERLIAHPFVAISGIKGETTMSSQSLSVRGKVRELGNNLLPKLFARNPYMASIYPGEESRSALTVFQLYEGSGEFFDLSAKPIFREAFSFGGAVSTETGYHIQSEKCIGCGACETVCPQSCISGTPIRKIDAAHCLHCGNCYRDCPAHAVEKYCL